MKINDNTLKYLKECSDINPSIQLYPGNVLRTLSPNKTIYAKFEVEDFFEQPALIVNLRKFLSILKVIDEPEVVFNDKYLEVFDKNNKYNNCIIKYGHPNTVVVAENRDVKFPKVDAVVKLTSENIEKIIKASSILQLKDIFIKSDNNGNVYLTTENLKESSSSDRFNILIGESDETLSIRFKVENFKLPINNYKVSISKLGPIMFESENIKYWIMSEIQ